MLYSPTDKTALLRMFHQQNLFEKQTKHLNDLIILLEDLVQCRHKNIMTYYGEERDGFMCSTSCDNCKNRGHYVATDGSSDAVKVVQAVMELTGKEVSLKMLRLFLAGSNQKSIEDKNLDTLCTFGSLKKQFVPIMLLQKFLNLLIYYDVLSETVAFKRNSISVTVVLGPNAHKVIDHKLYIPKFEKL
jgi:superfamily II DNA helicase RecQ